MDRGGADANPVLDGVGDEVAAPPAPRSLLGGIAIMLTGAVSNQTGAAIGAHAFPFIGPAGVVAVRQIVAAASSCPWRDRRSGG